MAFAILCPRLFHGCCPFHVWVPLTDFLRLRDDLGADGLNGRHDYGSILDGGEESGRKKNQAFNFL